MIGDIILTNKPWVVRWVSDKIKGDDCFPLESPCFGLLRGNRLVAGVVYTSYDGTGMTMNVASDGSRRWMTKAFLRLCFWFPFIQMKCRRVTGLVRTDNTEAQRFDEHLGFKKEGVIRQGDDDGCDLILYGMLAHECRWIKE